MCMLPDLAALSDAEHLLRAAAHWTPVSIRMRSLTQYWATAAGKGLDFRLDAKPDFFFFKITIYMLLGARRRVCVQFMLTLLQRTGIFWSSVSPLHLSFAFLLALSQLFGRARGK